MRRFLNKVFGGKGDQARSKAGGSPRRRSESSRPVRLNVEQIEERMLLSCVSGSLLSANKPVQAPPPYQGERFYKEGFPPDRVTDGRLNDTDNSFWLTLDGRDMDGGGNAVQYGTFTVDLQSQNRIERIHCTAVQESFRKREHRQERGGRKPVSAKWGRGRSANLVLQIGIKRSHTS